MNKIEYFDENKDGHDYVCGDIHGCFTLLEEELKEIGFNEETDRLFCVGDLVDRGPESERCIEFLDKPWFNTVRGNHEQMIINKDTYIHQINGGFWYSDLYQEEKDEIYRRFCKLPYVIKVGNIAIIHADIPYKCKTWDDIVDMVERETFEYYNNETFLWSRQTVKKMLERNIEGIDKIYLGHTIIKNPIELGNMIFIDTGSFLYDKDLYSEQDNKPGITVVEMKTGKKYIPNK